MKKIGVVAYEQVCVVVVGGDLIEFQEEYKAFSTKLAN